MTSQVDAVVALLREIGESQPNDTTIYWIDCGLHSGFPPCCVSFFVRVWAPLTSAIKTAEVHTAITEYRSTLAKFHERGDLHGGYVPCPDCLQKQCFVVPKNCGPHLNAEERDQVREALAKCQAREVPVK